MSAPIYQADAGRILNRQGEPTWLSAQQARETARYLLEHILANRHTDRNTQDLNDLLKAYREAFGKEGADV